MGHATNLYKYECTSFATAHHARSTTREEYCTGRKFAITGRCVCGGPILVANPARACCQLLS